MNETILSWCSKHHFSFLSQIFQTRNIICIAKLVSPQSPAYNTANHVFSSIGYIVLRQWIYKNTKNAADLSFNDMNVNSLNIVSIKYQMIIHHLRVFNVFTSRIHWQIVTWLFNLKSKQKLLNVVKNKTGTDHFVEIELNFQF